MSKVQKFRHKSGSVGIGTAGPLSGLQLRGDDSSGGSTSARLSIYAKQSGTPGFENIVVMGPTGTSDNDGYFQLLDSSVATVNIAADNARGGDTYFNGGGKVGIGTVSPGSKLEAENTASANDVLLLEDSSGLCEAQPTTTDLTWSCSSDEKLKTNINPSRFNALNYVIGIPLFDYTVKKTGENATGWVAQEMLKNPLYADLVTNRTYFTPETNQTESELSVSFLPKST